MTPPDTTATDAEDEILDWYDNYVPMEYPVDEWRGSNVQRFVGRQLDRLDTEGLSSARKCALELARVATFTLEDDGHGMCADGPPLDVEEVLHPDNVERFAASYYGHKCKGTVRSRLRRMGRELTDKAPWSPPTEPLRRRSVAPSYSDEEIDRLVADSRVQNTPLRERTFRTFLALGLGAGLDGRWVTRVTPRHVATVGGVTVVTVDHDHPRGVPVLAEWEDEVRELARIADRDELLVGGAYEWDRNLASNRKSILELGDDTPKLRLARLRSTWLVRHMRRGTRLPELALAAGLEGITTLSDLLDEVGRLPEADARDELRGGRR